MSPSSYLAFYRRIYRPPVAINNLMTVQLRAPAELPMNMKRDKGAIERYTEYRRSTANARERSRMHKLNTALDRLRRHLPMEVNMMGKARLSKIETLKVACNYIAALSDALEKGQSLSSATLCLRLSRGISPLKGQGQQIKRCILHVEKQENPRETLQNCVCRIVPFGESLFFHGHQKESSKRRAQEDFDTLDFEYL